MATLTFNVFNLLAFPEGKKRKICTSSSSYFQSFYHDITQFGASINNFSRGFSTVIFV